MKQQGSMKRRVILKVLLNDKDVHIVHRNPGYPFINTTDTITVPGEYITTTDMNITDIGDYIGNGLTFTPDLTGSMEFNLADS